ncbi:unnamed protein product [Paramecium primaurelia]|uniref:EF-hand domain-containing protein n=2 Tax=Paramecium TaxID=5884 RepID=A0A8S1UEX7_9CILI|nr:unnamed protein product [Paramecium primaurelia]CAD8163448.1 unnamed protein product [Paramecium pentaurelia]
MKRKPTLNAEYQDLVSQAKSMFNLSQDEMNEIIIQVKKFDPKGTGYVGKHEVDDVLRDLKLLDNDKLINKFNEELKIMNAKFLDLKQICDLYCKLKQYQQQLNEEETITQEYIDAFCALGGQLDKSGFVLKSTIIETIRKEFELNFDLDQILGEHGIQLDFDEFCQLFENAGDDAKSLLTSISLSKRNQNDFIVRYKDFEKWEKSVI